MKTVVARISVVAAIAAVCFSVVFTPPNQLSSGIPFTFANVQGDEATIYSAVLKKFAITEETERLIISPRPLFAESAAAGFPYGLDIPIPYTVVDTRKYDIGVVSVGQGDTIPLQKQSISDLFDGFPESQYVALSRIRFNDDRTEATVNLDLVSFGCSSGREIKLGKELGKWKIVSFAETWVT